MIEYAHRTLAAVYLICWAILGTSKIGQPGSIEPLDWQGAWTLVLIIALAMRLGWKARQEQEEWNANRRR